MGRDKGVIVKPFDTKYRGMTIHVDSAEIWADEGVVTLYESGKLYRFRCERDKAGRILCMSVITPEGVFWRRCKLIKQWARAFLAERIERL